MRVKTRVRFVFLVICVSAALACGVFAPAVDDFPVEQATPQASVQPQTQDTAQKGFGEIVFAEDVTDDGVAINPTNVFPAGTRLVYAYFTYRGMTPGETWGHYWTMDGIEYIDGRGEAWDEGAEGWTAYYIDDEVLSGEISLTLYIGDAAVQTAAFTVEEVERNFGGGGSFGSIQFAEGVTEELVPIGLSFTFAEGLKEIYAVFPFFNMEDGQDWSREWYLDGVLEVFGEGIWDEGADGLSYASYSYTGGEALDPGTYTLYLYIGQREVASGQFEIVAEIVEQEPQGPPAPEDLIDPNLLPAWEILNNAGPEILNDLADFALQHHIEMYLDADLSANGRYICSNGDSVGPLYISQSYWNAVTWEEVAATMAHELTHAVQDLVSDNCGCTIENEYYAYITAFYVLQETGRMDLLEEKWRGAYNDDGSFDGDLLWDAVKEAYSECPDY